MAGGAAGKGAAHNAASKIESELTAGRNVRREIYTANCFGPEVLLFLPAQVNGDSHKVFFGRKTLGLDVDCLPLLLKCSALSGPKPNDRHDVHLMLVRSAVPPELRDRLRETETS